MYISSLAVSSPLAGFRSHSQSRTVFLLSWALFVALSSQIVAQSRPETSVDQPTTRNVPYHATTTDRLNLRSSPSTISEIIKTLAEGSTLKVLEVRAQWFRVVSGTNQGWVSAGYVLPFADIDSADFRDGPSPPFPAKTKESLNIRSEPRVGAKKIGFLPPRRQLTVVEARQRWYRIESEELSGWVASVYIDAIVADSDVVSVVASAANQETASTTSTNPTGPSRKLRLENSRLASKLAEAQLQTRQATFAHTSLEEKLEASRERVANANTSNQALSLELTTLKNEATASQDRIVELEEALETPARKSKDRSRLRQLRSEKRNLQEQVDELTSQVEELQEQLVRVAGELKEGQADVEAANVALRSVLSENRELQEQLTTTSNDQNNAAPLIGPGTVGSDSTLAELTPLEPLEQPIVNQLLTEPPSSIAASPLQPAPVDEPVAAAIDPTSLVAAAVDNWKSAWSAQDVERYLAAYSPNFSPPNGVSLAAWQQRRAQRIRAPEYVEIHLGTLQLQQLAPDQVKVTFLQEYRTSSFSDQVHKTLILEWTSPESWLILSEVSTQR